jgi:hypothetical protein
MNLNKGSRFHCTRVSLYFVSNSLGFSLLLVFIRYFGKAMGLGDLVSPFW